jgi:hypothetical protein
LTKQPANLPLIKPSAENREERNIGGGEIHTILYWIDKDNPTGPPPANPQGDPQFTLWETPIRAWVQAHGYNLNQSPIANPQNTNAPGTAPTLQIVQPTANANIGQNEPVSVYITHQNTYPIKRAEFYLNNIHLGDSAQEPLSVSFIPQNVGVGPGTQTLRVVLFDTYDNKGEASIQITIRN